MKVLAQTFSLWGKKLPTTKVFDFSGDSLCDDSAIEQCLSMVMDEHESVAQELTYYVTSERISRSHDCVCLHGHDQKIVFTLIR